MRHRRGVVVLCLVIGMFLSYLPAGAVDDREPTQVQILTVGSNDQMKTRNILPAIAQSDPQTMAVLARVYDTPVQRNATTGVIVPRLAVGIDANGDNRLDPAENGSFVMDPAATAATVFYDLRNARFHDGVRVTGMDLLFSYHLLALNPVASTRLRSLMDRGGGPGSNFTVDRWLSVLAVDDGDGNASTVALRFTLASPYPIFPWAVLGIPVLPRHIYEGTGGGRHADWGLAIYPEGHPREGQGVPTWETTYIPLNYGAVEAWQMTDGDVIGSGHFRFVTWAFGQYARLDANRDYTFGAPKIDGILFRMYRTTVLGVLALKNGEIDLWMPNLPPEFIPDLQTEPDIQILQAPDLFPETLVFNVRRQPFGYNTYPPPDRTADIGLPLRKAFAHLVDGVTMARVLLSGYGSPADSLVSPANDGWYNRSLPKYQYSTLTAESILNAQGWTAPPGDNCMPDGTGCRSLPVIGTRLIDILTPQADYDPIRASAGAMIASAARSIELNVNSKPTAFGAILSAINARDFDMAILADPDVHSWDPWTLSRGDPDYLFDFVHSSNAAAGRNALGFWDAPFDAASEASRSATDFPSRSALVGWEQGILAERLPLIPMYFWNHTWAFRTDRFTGWELVSETVLNYWTLQGLEPAPIPPNPGPVITLNSPPDGAFFPAGTAIDLDVTDSDLYAVVTTLDYAFPTFLYPPWDVYTSSWTEGPHTLNVTAIDSTGNTTVAGYSFTVDSLAPDIALISPANGSLVLGNAVLDFRVVDPNLVGAGIAIDGGAPSAFLPPYDVPVSGLADGPHRFSIEATDAAGNSAARRYEVTVDATAPTVVESAPTGEVSLPIASIRVRFSEAVNRTSAEAAFSLTDGERTWRAADGTFFWDGDTSFVFVPDGDLERGAPYEARLDAGLTDLAGNGMAADHVWTFTIPLPRQPPLAGPDPLWLIVIALLLAAVLGALLLLLWGRRRKREGEGPAPPVEPKP